MRCSTTALVKAVPCGTADPAVDDVITVLDASCWLSGNESLLIGRTGWGQKMDGDYSGFAICPAWEEEAEACLDHTEGCQFEITNLCDIEESCG